MTANTPVEICQRQLLHVYQAKPWRPIGEAVCGATPMRPDHLLPDLPDAWRAVNYVTFRGRQYRSGPHAITEYRGQTRKLCPVCMRGGDRTDGDDC